MRRESPRRPEFRQPDYDDLFDDDTLFYDVFRGAHQSEVICVGPPLLDRAEALAKAVFRDPTGDAIAWGYHPPRTQYQPSCRFTLSSPGLARAERIHLEIAGRKIEIPIRESGHARFAGRRIIWTLSKDNPLGWIRDWAAFNAAVHGADAVLFYDNGSSAYGLDEVDRVLSGVPGLSEVLTIPWDFPYGPGTGPKNIQDSFYCQPGAIEHARRRFCGEARAVLNSDIDELMVVDGGGSVFDRLERSGKGVLVVSGFWVESVATAAGRERPLRHADCLYAERWRSQLRRFLRRRWMLRAKWIVSPRLCPQTVDWGVHDLYVAPSDLESAGSSWKLRPRDLFFRHFRPINTGWKRPSWRARRRSPIRLRYDRHLARDLAAVGGARVEKVFGWTANGRQR